MAKINQHIEIVRTSHMRFSSMSQKSGAAILEVLSDSYTKAGITLVDSPADLANLLALKPDLVFLGMNRLPFNSQIAEWLTDYLDEHDIAYTGSNQAAHRLEADKVLAKQRIVEAGLATAAYFVTSQVESLAGHNINYPVFIKPSNRGGGLGIDADSVAYDSVQMCAKVQSITDELQSDSLVEEYLAGREFSVAIIKDEFGSDYLALPIELVAPPDEHGIRMLSGRVKSNDLEQAIVVDDVAVSFKVSLLAIDAFQALGGRDYGRIDIRLDTTGKPHFLEANLIPSLIAGYGSFPKACLINLGLDYESMILKIVRLGLVRKIQIDDPVHLPILNSVIIPTLEPDLV